MRVLHIGMLKTGTTSIQRALRESGHHFYNDPTGDTAWDAVQLRPEAGELVPWPGDDTWARAMREYRHLNQLVISQEELCRASAERIPRLLASTAPDIVCITFVPPAVALPRWHTQLRRMWPQTAKYTEWRDATRWRGNYPSPDGIAVRPDVVAHRWRVAGAEVVTIETLDCAVQRFFRYFDLGSAPEVYENVSHEFHYDMTLTAESDAVHAAVVAGTVADI